MRVVGLDPSTTSFGIVTANVDNITFEVKVLQMQLVKTSSEKKQGVAKSSDDLRRARECLAAMNNATKGANMVVTEVPFFNPAGYAAANLNTGIMIGILASCNPNPIQVSPQDVKMASIGHRQAAKEEMIEWAMDKHPEAPWLMVKRQGVMKPINDNEHLADALAAIYAGIQSQWFKQLMAAASTGKFS